MSTRGNAIYLDHGATTPLHPAVEAAMAPYWQERYGNPSSHHATGAMARRAVERARQTVAGCLNAPAESIIFTGCGSESNNLALRGALLAARAAGRGDHLVTSAIEHSAVLATARQLHEYYGHDLSVVGVDVHGRVSPDDVRAALRPATALISIMAANNEIGTVQPWEAIGDMARQHGVLFHTDAVQLIAHRTWDMAGEPIDLMTIAPHKFYGPKGIGLLYVRPGVELIPNLTGGGQEQGLRAGTLNVPLIVGAAEALRLAVVEREQRLAHSQGLRDRLINGLLAQLGPDVILTGHPTQRLPNHASFAFRGLSGNDLLIHLDQAGIAASSGSACSSGDPKPSAVLEALGLDAAWTKGGLRLTLGMQTTAAEVDEVIARLPQIADRLRALEGLAVA